jgi:hypothetical protein
VTRPISDLDVPLTTLQAELRALVTRQRQQLVGPTDRSAQRLQTVLAPTTQPDIVPEEGQQ